jgi:hypothetical protein
MANAIVLGAEVNWWRAGGREDPERDSIPGLA